MKKFVSYFCYILFSNVNFLSSANSDVNNGEQLKLLSVIFRHGDRAPDEVEMFPKNPNYYNGFYPEGLGGLTNKGKLREYNLGVQLRENYSDFLGEIYLPKSVFARSTDYDRTKMSLQLVLAGLYPTRHKQIWNHQLLWQPIPTTYVPSKLDWLMIPEECPEYRKERLKAEQLEEVKQKIRSFEVFMKNLTELTGKEISTTLDMYNLYFDLAAESSMKLKLPKWAKYIFPEGKLLDGIKLEYEIFSYTKKMRRLNGGKLLHQLIKEMKKVEDGRMHKNRRIDLYSGHETNVAAILQTLGVFDPHVPDYSSAVIFEFVQLLDEKYYVKVYYYKGVSQIRESMQIPGCDFLCPFEKFIDLLEDVTPSSEELKCDKSDL